MDYQMEVLLHGLIRQFIPNVWRRLHLPLRLPTNQTGLIIFISRYGWLREVWIPTHLHLTLRVITMVSEMPVVISDGHYTQPLATLCGPRIGMSPTLCRL